MNNVTHIAQRYRQAPWRVQRQWIGLFFLALVLVALVASIYLHVTARAALAGREIQNLKREIVSNQLVNADLETQLAALTSAESMEGRARALGFEPVELDALTYVAVPGYTPESPIDLSSDIDQPDIPLLLPEYTQSLFDWFAERLVDSSSHSGANLP